MDDRDIDVSVLQIGIHAAARALVQSKMREIAERGDTSRPDGLVEMLRETISVLRQAEESWTHAAAQNHSPMPAQEAEPKFALAAHRARSRFQHELIRAYAGDTATRTAPPIETPKDGDAVVVVTLVVAARVELADVSDVRDRAELERALAALSKLDPGDFVAMEVIWSPADERERMSAAQVEARYPELVRLSAKVS
jgi:uncharacterized membrane protein